jgi:hypothetical protein
VLVLTEIPLRESVGISHLRRKPGFRHNIANCSPKQVLLVLNSVRVLESFPE